MEKPMTDLAQSTADYISSMLESFEHENPGIAELLFLHDQAMRYYTEAASAYQDPVVRISSSHSALLVIE